MIHNTLGNFQEIMGPRSLQKCGKYLTFFGKQFNNLGKFCYAIRYINVCVNIFNKCYAHVIRQTYKFMFIAAVFLFVIKI